KAISLLVSSPLHRNNALRSSQNNLLYKRTGAVTLPSMRETDKLRCGILGTGWMFGKFADAFQLIDEAVLMAVASRDGERARAAANKRKVQQIGRASCRERV